MNEIGGITSLLQTPLLFSSILRQLERQVSQSLWSLLLFHHLTEHLEFLRNLFLLGDGSFWSDFLNQFDDSIQKETNSLLTRDSSLDLISQIMLKCQPSNNFWSQIHWCLTHSNTNPYTKTLTNHPLEMTCVVDWPLNVVIGELELKR